VSHRAGNELAGMIIFHTSNELTGLLREVAVNFHANLIRKKGGKLSLFFTNHHYIFL
jgi:hypothetical protein